MASQSSIFGSKKAVPSGTAPSGTTSSPVVFGNLPTSSNRQSTGSANIFGLPTPSGQQSSGSTSIFGKASMSSSKSPLGSEGGPSKQSAASSSFFSASTSQASSSQSNFFGFSTPAGQPQSSLFGSTTPQTNYSFDSYTPQTYQPQASKSAFSANPPSSLFGVGRSTTPASPSPMSRSSRVSVSGTTSSSASSSGSGTVTPDTAATSRTQSVSGRETTPQPPPPKTYVDWNGDLCLVVGPVGAEFVVCSKTMARSSPFWKKMLYGEFAEGKKAQPGDGKSEWVVKLPEDNIAAMTIILNIIHGRFDKIAGYEDFVYTTHFYNLCVLTDKYDMTHILRPWAKGWSRSTHTQCEKLGQSLRTKFCHERLWISWELGDQATFEAMAVALLMNSSSAAGNHLRYVGALEPPGIYERIEQVRSDTIRALLKPVNDMIRVLVENSIIVLGLSSCYGHSKNDCIPLMLGKFTQALHRHRLWPIPDAAADSQFSISTLATTLQLVESELSSASHCFRPHTAGLRVAIEKALNSIPPLLTDAHRKHLKSRAKKTGFAPSRLVTPDEVPVGKP